MDASTETIRYAAVMLVAGLGIPVLAALNAALGVRLASPAAEAVCLFAVAFLTTALYLVLTGPQAILGAPRAPNHLFLGGVLVAFYILTITWIAPKFGVGNAIFFVLLGQLISAAVIDHFGLMGARISPLTLTRAAGVTLMAVGVLLTQRV